MLHPKLAQHIAPFLENTKEVHPEMEKLWTKLNDCFIAYDREIKILEQASTVIQEDFENLYKELQEKNYQLDKEKKIVLKKNEMLAEFPTQNPNPVFRIGNTGEIIFQNEAADAIQFVTYNKQSYSINNFFAANINDFSVSGRFELTANGRYYLFNYTQNAAAGHINFYGVDISEQVSLQQKSYDNFYRLNNFLEATDAVFYIVYKTQKEKNFFTSRWPLFFGFNPTKVIDPLIEKKNCILIGSLSSYEAAMDELELQGKTTVKYQVENVITLKKIWIQEDIQKKFDSFTNDEVIVGRLTDITGTEFYREYIIESEKRFQKITDSLPVMTWVTDHTKKITYSNDAVIALFGKSLSQIKFRTFLSYIHKDYKDQFLHLWDTNLKNNEIFEGYFLIKVADGTYHYLHAHAVPRFLATGEFVGYVGTFFDLTKEYEYNLQLESDKKQFELIALNSSDIILITDWKGTISYISPTVDRLLGHSTAEVLGTKFTDYLFAPCIKRFVPLLKKSAFNDEPVRTLVFRMKRKDLSTFWVEAVVTPIENSTIKGQHLILHISDINAQETAHQLLKESEEKYRLLFENMELGVMEVDLDDNILYCNDAFSKITGYFSDEIVGLNALDLLLDKKGDNISKYTTIKEERKIGDESVYELGITRKNGDKALLVISGAPLYDTLGNVRGSVGIHWDITEIREMERLFLEEKITKEKEILEAKLQAEEEQRAQIGRDLHDGVGQMLAYITIYLNMIKAKEKFELNEVLELEKTVKLTLEQVRTLSRTLTPPAIRDLGLRDAVVELIDSYGILEKPVFKLVVYPQKQDDKLSMEKKIVIFRVLQELLNNTFKYAEADTVIVKLYFAKGYFYMEYNDDGKGFDIKYIKKGVGLDSMLSRISFYKGDIDIKSAPGKGLSTTIKIPIQ